MFLVGLVLGAIFVTPLVILYVLFIRWCHRFDPAPWWLVGICFVWGALFATFGGGMSSGLVQSVVARAAGIDEASAAMEAFGATVLAPVFEEGFKGIGVALIALVSALGLRKLNGPIDGAIFGGIVGLGFTMTEDILYVAKQFAEQGFAGFLVLYFLRTMLLGLSHCTFTACTGLGFGIAAEAKSRWVKVASPFIGFGCAMAMHAVHNGLPTFFHEVGLLAMLVISWAIDFAFFILLFLLVARDRSVVIRELMGEVGNLLQPAELKLVSSYAALSWRNMAALFSRGFATFRARRKKQLALVELAFVKSRRRRGESGRGLEAREAKLRADIQLANQRGVFIGN